MFKSKKPVLISILIILALGLPGWRFWPRSFNSMTASEGMEVTSLACSVSIAGITDDGQPDIETYSLKALFPDEEDYTAILDILNSTDYRPDFRNLIVRPITEVQLDYGQSVTIAMVWENQETGALFLNGDKVSVSRGNRQGFLIFHPADSKMVDKLVTYVQLHGTKE